MSDEFERKAGDDPNAAILPSKDLLAAAAARFRDSEDESSEEPGDESAYEIVDDEKPSGSHRATTKIGIAAQSKPYQRSGNFDNYSFSSSATNDALTQLRRRERFIERLTWMFATGFVVCVIVAVILSDDGLKDRALAIMVQAKEAAVGAPVNCKDPKFAKTQDCMNKLERTEAEWRAIMRNQEGKVNPFAIHGKE